LNTASYIIIQINQINQKLWYVRLRITRFDQISVIDLNHKLYKVWGNVGATPAIQISQGVMNYFEYFHKSRQMFGILINLKMFKMHKKNCGMEIYCRSWRVA